MSRVFKDIIPLVWVVVRLLFLDSEHHVVFHVQATLLICNSGAILNEKRVLEKCTNERWIAVYAARVCNELLLVWSDDRLCAFCM